MLFTTVGYMRLATVSTKNWAELIITSGNSPTSPTLTFPLCTPPPNSARAMYKVVLSHSFPPLQRSTRVRGTHHTFKAGSTLLTLLVLCSLTCPMKVYLKQVPIVRTSGKTWWLYYSNTADDMRDCDSVNYLS